MGEHVPGWAVGPGGHLQPEPAAVGPNCRWQRAGVGPQPGSSTPGRESAGAPAPGDPGAPVPALGGLPAVAAEGTEVQGSPPWASQGTAQQAEQLLLLVPKEEGSL